MSSSWCVNDRSDEASRAWFQRVSPAGPKNTARWLLSTPWTCQPRASKWVATSLPMRPEEPVTRRAGEIRMLSECKERVAPNVSVARDGKIARNREKEQANPESLPLTENSLPAGCI